MTNLNAVLATEGASIRHENLTSPSCAEFVSGRALLDPQGLVQAATPELELWLQGQACGSKVKGQPLSELLAKRCKDWEKRWGALISSRETFTDTRWELPGKGSEKSKAFAVELTQYDTGKLFKIGTVQDSLASIQERGVGHQDFKDDHDRQRFFALIRKSEHFQNVLQRWPGVVFSQRPDGSFFFVSPRIEALTGIGVGDWERDPGALWKVVLQEDLPALRAHLQAAVNQPGSVVSMEFRIRNLQTGVISQVKDERQALKTQTGLLLGYDGSWVDVTTQRAAEKRLKAAAWKETIAALTPALTHDFRNFMSVVITVCEVCLPQVPADSSVCSALTSMKSNAWTATEALQKVSALYHRRAETNPSQYADVNQVIRQMEDICRKLLVPRIRLETSLSQSPAIVCLDVFELQQAILSLTLNAKESMPAGGKVEIETKHHQRPQEGAFLKGRLPKGPAICVTVRDSGNGVPPEHLPQLFDPFLTPKAPESGSGLGLCSVLGFAERFGGAVSVETAPGKGAAFKVWLPEADLP